MLIVIIAAIAIASISGIIKNSSISAFKSNAKMVLKQLNYEKLKNENFDFSTLNIDNLDELGVIKLPPHSQNLSSSYT